MPAARIRTVSGSLGYNATTGLYEGEWYGRGIEPELARAIRKYKVTPSQYDQLVYDYDYDQERMVKELKRWCDKGMGPHYRMMGRYDRISGCERCNHCGEVIR